MGVKSFSVPEIQHIYLEVQGDLHLMGWDEPRVEIRGEGEEELIIERSNGELVIRSPVSCRVSLSSLVAVTVRQVQGDLQGQRLDSALEVNEAQEDVHLREGSGPVRLQAVHGDLVVERQQGPLSAETVHGDALMRDVSASVDLKQVKGDLRARAVEGALRAEVVEGDALVREIAGPLTLGQVKGDFSGVTLDGGAEVRQVIGDVAVNTRFAPGQGYVFQADGDVRVRVPLEVSARFTVEAKGEIRCDLPLVEEVREPHRVVGVLGDGEAHVTLVSRQGSVFLKERAPWEGLEEVGRIGWHAESIARLVEQRLTEELSQLGLEEIARREAERARREVERALRRAEAQAEKIRRRAEKKAEKARLRMERSRRRAEAKTRRAARKGRLEWRLEWGAGRRPAGEPVTEEERLLVLRMLQEGKITAEEAARLLEALEG